MKKEKDFLVQKTKIKQKEKANPIRKLRNFCGYTSTIIETGIGKDPGTPKIQ